MTTALGELSVAAATTNLGELQGLAAGLCLDAGILVEASDEKGCSWHYNHARRAIVVPATDIRSKGAAYCAGVLAHEVGHFFISRYHEMSHGIGFPSAAILGHLLNATEDPRVNTWVKLRYPGTRQWFEALRDDFREPPIELPEVLTFGIECHAEEILGWVPRRPGLLPARVERALAETREARIAMAGCLPSRVPGCVLLNARLAAQVDQILREMPAPHAAGADAAELEVLMQQGRSLALFRDGVVPRVRPLLEADVLRLGWHLLGRGLLHLAKRLNMVRADRPGRLASGAARYLLPEVRRAMAEVVEPPTTWTPDPLDREGLVRLIEIFINGQFPGAVGSSTGPCPRPGAGRRGSPGAAGGKAVTCRKSPAESAGETPGANPGRITVDGVDQLERLVRDGLNPGRHRRHHGSFASGSRLSMREARRLDAEPERYRRLWQRPVRPTRPDAAFGLLVDLSGSMSGSKIEAAVKGTLLLAETLGRLQVPCLIHGFQNRLVPLTEWGDGFDRHVRGRIASMALEVDNRRPGGNNKAGNNDDGPCLEEFAALVGAHPARQKFLVVVSDGEPAGERSSPADLVRAVAKVTGRGDIHLIGLGLGQGTGHVAKYYPVSIANVSVGEFPAKIGGLILRACGVA